LIDGLVTFTPLIALPVVGDTHRMPPALNSAAGSMAVKATSWIPLRGHTCTAPFESSMWLPVSEYGAEKMP
jgi:hypothetical protein